MFRAAGLLLAVSLLGTALPAQAGKVVKKPEFTLTLPDDWAEAPQATMATFNANVAAALPNLPKARIPFYKYGFQRKSDPHWLTTYPYMVVRIKTSGRIPESTLAQVQRVNLNKALRKHKKQLPADLLKQISLNKPLYDPSTHTIWITGNMTGREGQPLRVLSALFPTKNGSIQLAAYVPAAKFASYYAMLHAIMMSVVIPPDLRY